MVKELKNTEHKLNESAQSSCISSSEIDRSHFSKLKKPKERVDQKTKKNQRKEKTDKPWNDRHFTSVHLSKVKNRKEKKNQIDLETVVFLPTKDLWLRNLKSMVKIEVLRHIFAKDNLVIKFRFQFLLQKVKAFLFWLKDPYKTGFLFTDPNMQLKSFLYLLCFERNRKDIVLIFTERL